MKKYGIDLAVSIFDTCFEWFDTKEECIDFIHHYNEHLRYEYDTVDEKNIIEQDDSNICKICQSPVMTDIDESYHKCNICGHVQPKSIEIEPEVKTHWYDAF